jgi:hypothetical protein
MAMTFQPAATEAAELINDQWTKTTSALLAIRLGVHHPDLRESFKQAAAGEKQTKVEGVQFKRKDGTYYGVRFHSSTGIALRRRQSWQAFERAIMMGMISLAAAVLDDYKYFDRAPVLEFVRHLRSGISHGNKFHFENNMPNLKYPARFGSFTVTKALARRRVLFDFMMPGDVFDLFDEVENHLRQLR